MRIRMLCIGLALLMSGMNAAAEAKKAGPQRAPAPVISASSYHGMFALYEANRTQGIGNYITVDFILTAYNLLLNDLLSNAEEEQLFPAFRDLTATLLTTLQQQEGKPPGYGTALAYVAMIQHLLEPNATLPPEAAAQVQAEAALVQAHQGIAPSAITGVQEDFSQYIPRGHYTRSETLQRYFQALLYAGRVGLFLRESNATGVSAALAEEHTAAALLLSRLITQNALLRQHYERLQHLLTFFVGPSDDLTPAEYVAAAGTQPPAQARQQILAHMKQAGRLPRILSVPVNKSQLEPGTSVAEASAGFRLVAQRYTPDAEAMQRLTYDQVTTYTGKGTPFTLSVIANKPVRGFPSVLDVMAGLGSHTATQVLTTRGDTLYNGYTTQMQGVASLLQAQAAQPVTLSSMTLRLARTLVDKETPERLNAALGAWIHTRHTFLLYSKQSYTVTDKSLKRFPERTLAAIEPAGDVYEVLLANLQQMATVLTASKAQEKLTAFHDIVQRLRTLTETQQRLGLVREPEDLAYLNEVDQHLQSVLSTTDAPVVVDLHTEPNSQLVLEAGLGYPLMAEFRSQLFHTDAITPRPASTPTHLRGARFHCYELKQPLAERLTDETWQKRLQAGDVPGSLTTAFLLKVQRSSAGQGTGPAKPRATK